VPKFYGIKTKLCDIFVVYILTQMPIFELAYLTSETNFGELFYVTYLLN